MLELQVDKHMILFKPSSLWQLIMDFQANYIIIRLFELNLEELILLFRYKDISVSQTSWLPLPLRK